MVSMLLEAGAKMDTTWGGSLTPLMIAVCLGHLAVVKVLLAAGAGTEQKLEDGSTPLL
jgi:ankyrin repeat protein